MISPRCVGNAAASHAVFWSRSKVSAIAYGRVRARRSAHRPVHDRAEHWRTIAQRTPHMWPLTVLYGRAARGMNVTTSLYTSCRNALGAREALDLTPHRLAVWQAP